MNLESGNTLPGGDSWIVYPKNGKLYSSIRLEAMRDGIADYTLLQMLAQKEPDLAKELCLRWYSIGRCMIQMEIISEQFVIRFWRNFLKNKSSISLF